MHHTLNVHHDIAGKMWENFESYVGGAPDPDGDYSHSSSYYEQMTLWIDFALKEYNAVDVRNTTLIRFETEEDALAFKLKFSG